MLSLKGSVHSTKNVHPVVFNHADGCDFICPGFEISVIEIYVRPNAVCGAHSVENLHLKISKNISF